MRRQIADLQQRFAVLEAQHARRRGPRDECDVVLITTIAQTAAHRSFTAREVLAHSAVDATLRRALDHADVRSAKQLGKLLRRVEGLNVVGLAIARSGRRRWRVLEVTK